MPIIRENSPEDRKVGLDLLYSRPVSMTSSGYYVAVGVFGSLFTGENTYSRYKVFFDLNENFTSGGLFVNLFNGETEIFPTNHWFQEYKYFTNLSGPTEATSNVTKSSGSVVSQFYGGTTISVDLEHPNSEYRGCNFIIENYPPASNSSTTFVGYFKTIGWWNTHLYGVKADGIGFYSGIDRGFVDIRVYGYSEELT